MTESLAWHGTHEVPENRMITVSVGPLVLMIAHRPGEWRLAWQRSDDVEPATPVSPPTLIVELEETFTIQRFLTRKTGDRIRLSPMLADRPVVARPETPLIVPGGDEATIFVSTPVWVRAELPEPDRMLFEMPAIRPSDTWFGPDTRRGVVAYASQTAARLSVDNLPPMSHRVITEVTVRNQVSSTLCLERVSVPTPNLTLFADEKGLLWTVPLLAVRDSESESARVELSNLPPAQAAGARKVAEPREPIERNVLTRALHVLVG